MSMEADQRHSSAHWPEDGLEQVLNCPVCGSPQRQPAYQGLTDLVFNCAPGRWDMYPCKDCKLLYLRPRPTAAAIGLAYSRREEGLIPLGIKANTLKAISKVQTG